MSLPLPGAFGRKVETVVEQALEQFRMRTWSAAQNRRWVKKDEPRFLVARHPGWSAHFFDVLLDWLALWFPTVRARFELHALPPLITDLSGYALHIPWLQDPVQNWSRTAHRNAMRLEARCDDKRIPIVNRVSLLTNAAKHEGSRRIASAGFRTAKMALLRGQEARFREDLCGIPLPLFVREDWGHGGLVLRASTLEEARAIDLSQFLRPVAVELVDVARPDGLYRKYRYALAGDVGVRHTMHVSGNWLTHGSDTAFDDDLRAEEIAWTRAPEPLHDRFVAARQALGLDFVAFDYGVDRDGRVVVWEANPYPYMHFVPGKYHFRQVTTTRVLAALACLYLRRAGLRVTSALAAMTEPPS